MRLGKTRFTKTLLMLSIAGLTACASTAPEYQQADDNDDYGYYENQITENRYRVNYNGKSTTESNEVKDMALLRAAELTKLNDYDWFRVVHQETEEETQVNQYTTGVDTTQQVTRSCGLLGCTTTVSPSYSRIEVQTAPGRKTYFTSVEIVMGKGEVEDATSVYDANELYSFLKEQY